MILIKPTPWWKHVMYFILGLGMMLVITFLSFIVPGLIFLLYLPWVAIGEWLEPTRGPGSHAMVSLGTLCAMAVGFVVYSFLTGIGIRKYWQRKNMR